MHPELKIKIVSLAAEIALIRQDERRYKRVASLHRRALMRAGPHEYRTTDTLRQRLHERGHPTKTRPALKIDQLSARLSTLDPETAKDQTNATVSRNMSAFWSLRGHVLELKEEIRAALFAYGFLRGRTRSRVEPNSRKPIPKKRIEQIARKFCRGPFDEASFKTWLDADAP